MIENKRKIQNLNIDGVIYKTKLNHKFENRKKWVEPSDQRVYSLIPGTIVKLCVKEGDKIKAGERLMVLESMKMKNNISVPYSVTIKSIKVKEGERIPKDQQLFEFEPKTENDD
jgi:pyruvate carboxylase